MYSKILFLKLLRIQNNLLLVQKILIKFYLHNYSIKF